MRITYLTTHLIFSDEIFANRCHHNLLEMELGNSVAYLKIRLISLSYVLVCFRSCLGTTWMCSCLQLLV